MIQWTWIGPSEYIGVSNNERAQARQSTKQEGTEMEWKQKPVWASLLVVAFAATATRDSAANGGPFVVKYPNGDPAAKGVLARLDPPGF